MSEPRTWWINIFSNVVFKDMPGLALQMDAQIIYVIEYSAYESLQESLMLAKKQRDEFEHTLKLAETFISQVAYVGYNGSPFPDEPRRELQSRFSTWAHNEFKKIFNRNP